MPADRIDRVEVATNPSAEFRSDGTGGVINLITKKAKGAGRTSGLRLTAGDSGRSGASGNIGYNGGKLSASGDLNYRRDPATQVDYERRRQADLDSETQGETQFDFESVTGQGSVDYDLSDRLHLGGEARLRRYDFAVDSQSDTAREDGAGRRPRPTSAT